MASSDGSPLLRHTLQYIAGRIATGLVGLLVLVALTHVLSPENYGRYAVTLAVAALVGSIGFQWLRQCLVRFGTAGGDEAIRSHLLGTLGALLVGILLVMAAIGGVGIWLSARTSLLPIALPAGQVIVIFSLVWAQFWFGLCTDAVRTEFKPWRYGGATLLRTVLTLILCVLVALSTQQVTLVVMAVAAAYLIASFVATPRWLSGMLLVRNATWSEARRLLAYGLPLAGTLGLGVILGNIDRLMLAGMQGYAEAGVYSSAYNLAQFSIGTLLAGLGLGSLPLAVKAHGQTGQTDTMKLLQRNLLLAIAICLPAVVGLMIVAPDLDRLLLGNFVPGRSAAVTIIIAAATGLAAIRSYCVDVVFMLHQHTWVQAMILGAAVSLNVLLNLILIPTWGSVGAAMATLASFAAAFVASWILSRRYQKIPLPLNETGKILLACGVMATVLILFPTNLRGWAGLLMSIAAGVLVYSVAVVALNVAEIRDRLGTFRAEHV